MRFSVRLEVDVYDLWHLLPGWVELFEDEVSAVGAQHLVVDLHAHFARLE